MVRFVVALTAGALTTAGFAPLELFYVPPVTLALLFRLWLDASPRKAFVTGLGFGLGLFGAGVSWVFISLHNYGHMPVALAVLCVMGLVSCLALFPATVGWLQARNGGGAMSRTLLVIPGLWVISEWLRGWLLTGFPWLSLGYSQVGQALDGLASLLGVYGVGLAVTLTAGALAAIGRVSIRANVAAISLVVAVWVLGWGLKQQDRVRPIGQPMKVALVQGNVALTDKWDSTQRPRILDMYWQLSRNLKADLIVWPEASLPYYLDELAPNYWSRLQQHPADFVFGVLERETRNGEVALYNSVVGVSSGPRQVYRKRHLVPFGEYLPLRPLFGWVLNYLHIPMSDFNNWSGPAVPFQVGGVLVGITICYEDAFPEELRELLPAAQVLLNVSEDAWFGDSLGPHQRLQMARMRALEFSRPMLRAANTGVSALIDHRGEVLANSPQFVQTVVKGTVQPMDGVTPFARYGHFPVLALGVLLVFGGLLWGRRRP